MKAYRCYCEPITTYELYMQNDINTKGSTQWFYFSAIAERRVKAKFRLINFVTPLIFLVQAHLPVHARHESTDL